MQKPYFCNQFLILKFNFKRKRMKKSITLIIILACFFSINAKPKKCKKSKKDEVVSVLDAVVNPGLATKLDTISYFLGMQIGTDMKKNGADEIIATSVEKGMEDALKGLPSKVDQQTGMKYAQEYFGAKQAEKQAKEQAMKSKFFEENAKRPGVKTTASGLQYEVLKDTIGPKPLATDKVTVHYTGTLLDGKVFDSSVGNEPVTFPLNQVIKGWTEGVQLMSVGSKYKFFIPGDLAYGEQGVQQAGIGPDETLIFEVELLKIEKSAPQVQQAPSNILPQGKD